MWNQFARSSLFDQESVFIIYRFTFTLLKVKGVSFFYSFLPAPTTKINELIKLNANIYDVAVSF